MARIRGTIAVLLIGTGAIGYGVGATGLVESVAGGFQRMAMAAERGASEEGAPSDPVQAPTFKVSGAVAESEARPVAVHQALAARGGEAGQPIALPPAYRGLRLAQAPDEQPSLKPVGSPRSDRGSAATPGSKESLTRAIQGELKRVGCFAGAVDGDWGASTRMAMQAFNDRVNAKLPTSHPDYILLTLLQGHSAQACGADCPPGQAKDDGGTCLPRSVIAEQRRRAALAKGTGPDGTTEITTGASASVAGGAPAGAVGQASRLAAAARVESPADTVAPAISRAEIEQQRIAAAEARRQQSAAEAAARAEGERLARLAAAEKARQTAEARRQEELARLRERSERLARKALPTDRTAEQRTAMAPPTPADQFAARDVPRAAEALSQNPAPSGISVEATAQPPVVAVAPAQRARPKPATRRASKPRGARYVGRFVPSSAYRLGRLAPTRVSAPVVLAFRARPRHNPQMIFRDLQHRMP